MFSCTNLSDYPSQPRMHQHLLWRWITWGADGGACKLTNMGLRNCWWGLHNITPCMWVCTRTPVHGSDIVPHAHHHLSLAHAHTHTHTLQL